MKTGGGSIPFKKTFCILGMCVLGCFAGVGASAQDAQSSVIPRSAAAMQAPLFSDAELDQMLAPIALYPDVLLTQTLIASTYPSEAIEAGNWLKANPNLRGKEAVEAASQTNWDDSIKALAAFPEILVPMAEYPDWTAGLGNAFLSQQQQLMNRVQYLRQKAKEQGNLKTNEQVSVQTTGQGTSQTIVIEPATTQIVYVPYYNPTVVYGTWWWPAYTPVYWNPWPYAGYVGGYSTGFMWSGAGLWFSYTSYRPVYDWHYHRVYIVDRHYRRPGPHRKPMPRREWNHRPEHRHDVSYRDKTYKPGANTPRPGQHGRPDRKPQGKPGERPQGSSGSNHMPGKNDRPSFDREKRPGSGSPQMGFTDNRHNGSRPGLSQGKPTDIPRKDTSQTSHDRPPAGHGNPVGPGMSGTRPVVNPAGQRPSVDKPSGVRPEWNGTPNRPQANLPGSGQTVNRPVNRPTPHQSPDGFGNTVNNRPGKNVLPARPGSNRPMQIPPVNRPGNNRPVSTPQTNKAPSDRPVTNPGTNKPTDHRPVQGPSANRPTNNRPSQRPEANKPSGNQSGPSQLANRPTMNRPVPVPAVSRPVENMRPAAAPANRPGSSTSRPAVNTRPTPAPSVNHRPASPPAVTRPTPSHAAPVRPSAGSGNHAASSPSRPSAIHESRSSGTDRGNNDRGHGR